MYTKVVFVLSTLKNFPVSNHGHDKILRIDRNFPSLACNFTCIKLSIDPVIEQKYIKYSNTFSFAILLPSQPHTLFYGYAIAKIFIVFT